MKSVLPDISSTQEGLPLEARFLINGLSVAIADNVESIEGMLGVKHERRRGLFSDRRGAIDKLARQPHAPGDNGER